MILQSIRVENFKSIEDSTEFSVGPVTCLVGKNEAGKSAVLQAIYKLKSVDDDASNFDVIEEYPRRHLSDYEERVRSRPEEPQGNVLTTVWELEGEDREAIAGRLGVNVNQFATVTASKGYDNEIRWAISTDIDEKKVIEHVLESAKLDQQELSNLQDTENIAALIEKLEAIEDPPGEVSDLLSTLQKDFPAGESIEAAIDILEERLPTFLYFDYYQKMPGQVSVDELVQKQAEGRLEVPR